MTRLSRKHRTDIEYKNCGGILDIFDDAMKGIWIVNDDEYDYVCEHATEEELDYFVTELDTYSKKKQALLILDKLLTKMYSK